MAGDETTPQKYTQFTPDRRQRFLERLRQRPNVAATAEAVGISRRTACKAYHQDPNFAAAWRDALNEVLDRAEDELYRRGIEGWSEPVFYQGDQVGTVRKFSDTSLTRFLQAHRPDLYAEKHIHRLAVEDPVNGALKAIDGKTLAPRASALGPTCRRPRARSSSMLFPGRNPGKPRIRVPTRDPRGETKRRSNGRNGVAVGVARPHRHHHRKSHLITIGGRGGGSPAQSVTA